MEVHPILHVGTTCTLYAESIESLKTLGTESVVLTSKPIVVWEISLLLRLTPLLIT